MKIRKQHVVGIILPILLFLIVVACDYQVFHGEMLPYVRSRFRELVLGLALVFMIWGTERLDWFVNRTLIQRLRFLGISVLMFWLGTELLSARTSSRFVFFGSTLPADHFFWTLVFFGVLVFSVWILVTLKELIYVQQGKTTERYFRLFLISIFLQIVYVLAGGQERVVLPTVFGGWEGNVILPFVALFAFVNGFRCKWIHYLNRKRKIGFLFFFVLISSVTTSLFFQATNPVQESSVVIGTFVHSLVTFCMIYSGMAVLGILLLLPSAGLMDRRIREIQSLQKLSATIGSVLDKEELISKTTELSVKVVGADASWLELKEGSSYRLAGSHGIKREVVERMPEEVQKVIRKETKDEDGALLINDLTKNKATKEIKKWKRKAGSILAARVRVKNKELGILYALKHETFGFVEDARGLFQAFADQVAVALENVSLFQVTVEQEVYREELRVAHEAQMRILPQTMPRIEGVELDAFCRTANEIGGDFYDLIQVDAERLDIVIGDVSGKGASAAFYMAELKGVIQALASHCSSPKEILVEMNGFLQNHFEPDTFVTMAYGIFLPAKKQIRIVRAGHPPVGLIREKKATWLEPGGIGLGLSSNDFFAKALEEKTLQLKKGDTVFFYTDGLSEARNRQGEEYGEDVLTQTLLDLYGQGAEEILRAIRERLEKFTRGVPMHDDITLVALRVLK